MNIGEAMENGGTGMWVLLFYGGIVLPLVWIYGVGQLLALIRWKRKMADLDKLASEKDGARLLERLGGGEGKDVAERILAEAARSSLGGDGPEEVMDGARSGLDERMKASTPVRAVLAMTSLALAALAPLVLGATFRCMKLVQVWGWLLEDEPLHRCRLLEVGTSFAEYPFRMGIVVSTILAVPALVAVFMELTALRAARRRDDVLRLVEMLLGLPPRPASRGAPGLIAFVLAILLTGTAGWVLTGPPVPNLAAPRLHDSCVHGLEGRSIRIPVRSGAPEAEDFGYKLFVTRNEIFLEVEHIPGFGDMPEIQDYTIKDVRVTDLVEGKPGAALDADGVTIEPLMRVLEETPNESSDDCSLLEGCGPPTVEPVLVVIDEDVPLDTAAAVLVTARRSSDRSVSVLVRAEAEPATPPRFADLLEAASGFASMKCVEHCAYGQIAVEDLVTEPAGSGKPVLDGRAGGTFGDFITGVGTASFDVIVP